jgi:hypothetical protein
MALSVPVGGNKVAEHPGDSRTCVVASRVAGRPSLSSIALGGEKRPNSWKKTPKDDGGWV